MIPLFQVVEDINDLIKTRGSADLRSMIQLPLLHHSKLFSAHLI